MTFASDLATKMDVFCLLINKYCSTGFACIVFNGGFQYFDLLGTIFKAFVH